MTHPPVFTGDIPGVDASSLETFRAFKRAMVLHRRLMMSLFGDEEIHPAQAGCLQALGAHNGMSQSDLAEALHVSRPTVTTMLQRMEAAGTIERRPDEHDSRVTRVYLTGEGRQMQGHVRDAFAESMRASFQQLTEAERRDLGRLLDRLNAHTEAALAQRDAPAIGHSDHHHDCEGH